MADKGDTVFNFVNDEEVLGLVKEPETATSGNPTVHQGLTEAQVLDAQSRAESKKGLDMRAFMKETNIGSLDFEELLKFKVAKGN